MTPEYGSDEYYREKEAKQCSYEAGRSGSPFVWVPGANWNSYEQGQRDKKAADERSQRFFQSLGNIGRSSSPEAILQKHGIPPPPPASFHAPHVPHYVPQPSARKRSFGRIFISIVCAIFFALALDVFAVLGLHATDEAAKIGALAIGAWIGWTLPMWLPPILRFSFRVLLIAFWLCLIGAAGYIVLHIITHR